LKKKSDIWQSDTKRQFCSTRSGRSEDAVVQNFAVVHCLSAHTSIHVRKFHGNRPRHLGR